MNKSWYRTWFNSPYYHLLYQHRNDNEAHDFIRNLINEIPIEENSSIIDIGCGKGRHSRYLNSRGFTVQGIDLAPQNIKFAKEFANETLSFDVCDMRTAFRTNYYDYAVNLFTSFGYFESDDDDLQSLRAMASSLKNGGKLILDYFNTSKLRAELKENIQTNSTCDHVQFKTRKYIKDKFVIKEIEVSDGKEINRYHERVKLIDLELFKEFIETAGLKLIEIYGDYELNSYDHKISDRMILIAEK